MVMLDWEHENFLRVTHMNMWERDLRLVLWLLWMMPLLEPKEMERITGFSENRCYKVLRELSKRRLVIREAMGRSGGKRFRYWLTRKGVLLVAEQTRCPIAWQVTETGVGWLIRRLPMVEAFYALAPKLMRHEGVKVDLPVILTMDPDGSGTTMEFTPEMKIYDFCWMSKDEIHAVVRFENKAWFPLVWVGSMVPEHQLIEKGKIAVQQLAGRVEPAGWAIVGFDRLAASLAAEFWPADNVLAVSTDGHIERKMHPGAFTDTALREEAKPARLGRPENVANWWRKTSKQYKPEMEALNSPLTYAIFRFIAEFYGPTPAQLERRFGTSYRAAVRALKSSRPGEETRWRFLPGRAGRTYGGPNGPGLTSIGGGSHGCLPEGGRRLPARISNGTIGHSSTSFRHCQTRVLVLMAGGAPGVLLLMVLRSCPTPPCDWNGGMIPDTSCSWSWNSPHARPKPSDGSGIRTSRCMSNRGNRFASCGCWKIQRQRKNFAGRGVSSQL